MLFIKILGFNYLNKEERKKRDEEVLLHYFRYGPEHKEKITDLLEKLIPSEKREYLIMYYMQIKDYMEKYEVQKFEEAVRQIKRKCIIISTNETVNLYYKAVMEADDRMNEDMNLPTADEIRKMVERNGKNYTL
ncbi:MAG: hypothetical protein LUH21_25810 [Clostridiales bacterium]|nr:hypothetical protein [Clostridiales bacterium]